MELIGVQFVNFTGRDGGKVNGVKLHCLDGDVETGKGVGQKVFSQFVSSDKCPKVPALGSHLEFVYNNFGRLQRFDVLE